MLHLENSKNIRLKKWMWLELYLRIKYIRALEKEIHFVIKTCNLHIHVYEREMNVRVCVINNIHFMKRMTLF